MRSYWKIIMGSLNPGKSEKPITKSRKAKNTKKKWWDVCDFYISCFYDGFYFIDNVYRFRIKGYSCRSGETGRRTGLKIPRGQPRVGSIPTSGTNDIKGLGAYSLLNPFLMVLSFRYCFNSGIYLYIFFKKKTVNFRNKERYQKYF